MKIAKNYKNCAGAGQQGIALLVAIGTMIIILIIASLAIYLITRGMQVTAGQTRYETAYEAAVASLEIGKKRAEYLNQALDIADTSEVFNVGSYTTNLYVERTASVAITLSGTAMKFARAIAGPGATPATGSYRTYYIRAISTGRAGEQVALEVLQRYTIYTE
ncbi:hypothetical protein BXT86_01690 [candidate division WOR-3 bacterium 4484_100]|uniref:Type 4 fimbrial biogenesis protein PilX N-terminal domain-containing protein n=1 Tax=candidate division WOR-3 bacterium 4484_100 TaxID=1936077 RepID=A0A1V4QG37_UNCW3|nr:MAG: hypothetical protein BXT86_01690 [candidate division WOR-3 bacterium 4484_100]